jgi:hypothetical protein
MAVDRVRPIWYLIRRTTLVVHVIYFMDWLMVSILEYRKLAFMGVETAQTGMMRLLWEDGWQDGWQNWLRYIFWHGIKVVFLQRTCAT